MDTNKQPSFFQQPNTWAAMSVLNIGASIYDVMKGERTGWLIFDLITVGISGACFFTVKKAKK